jgi:CTP synthase (UTP-ammonia lyase)
VKTPQIALIGDYNAEVVAHQAIPKALELASAILKHPLRTVWIETSNLRSNLQPQLSDFDAIWCVPASPYANTQGVFEAIRLARETARPFLGTCGGFQHALLEYARAVLGFEKAAHAEIDSEAEMQFIAPLSCSLVEKSGVIAFEEGSKQRIIYDRAAAEEQYHCRYGLNSQYEALLQGSRMHICARDLAGEARAVELEGHPFFIATLFQPERAALRGEPHPLINAFVSAADAFQR